MSDRRLLFLVVAAAGLLAAGHPAIPADANPTDTPALRLEPRAHPLTSFEFTGRIKITNKDVSFHAPDDYQESFSFWTQKMKNYGSIHSQRNGKYVVLCRALFRFSQL